jgi:hypothetical protein
MIFSGSVRKAKVAGGAAIWVSCRTIVSLIRVAIEAPSGARSSSNANASSKPGGDRAGTGAAALLETAESSRPSGTHRGPCPTLQYRATRSWRRCRRSGYRKSVPWPCRDCPPSRSRRSLCPSSSTETFPRQRRIERPDAGIDEVEQRGDRIERGKFARDAAILSYCSIFLSSSVHFSHMGNSASKRTNPRDRD